MPNYHLGIDVGGTFTDAVLVSRDDGSVRRAKARTTPEDQSKGVLDVIGELGIAASEIAMFTHGHTVAINALLERKGPLTGLICTEGTRDMLDMGGLVRPPGDELYDATWIRPHLLRPLVHRRHIRDIRERLVSDGSVHVQLDEESVRREIAFLRDEGVETVAVCLLHAYLNPEHERRVAEIVREMMPDAYVQTSSIRPVIGELDRTFTVVLNAYTGPVITRYLTQLRERLAGVGYEGEVLVTQMNGGVRTIDHTIAELPGYTIQSGPTAGLLGAEAYAREVVDEKNFLCVDIGGTSTDIGLVDDGQALTTDDWELEFGIRLGFPALDVRSIGAGGGSIIQLDELGTLRIGPDSAGADPGPACYGRGGTQPAMTDALVAMGVIQPELFLDGRMALSRDAALAALETVAGPLAMSPLELACGAFNLMNAQIEQESSKIMFERAADPNEFVLLGYGGAGPAHAAAIARIAGVRRVLIPYFPGGFSALGMVVAPLRAERAVSVVGQIDVLGPDRLQEVFDGLEAQVRADLTAQGLAAADTTVERSLHGHYIGQGFANRVGFESGTVTADTIERWKTGFHAFYDKAYGYSAPESPIEVTTMTVSGSGRPGSMPVTKIPVGGVHPDDSALVMTRDVCLDGSTWQPLPFYHRSALRSGNRVEGPAVIDDGLSTIFVVPDSTASVDDFGNIMIDLR